MTLWLNLGFLPKVMYLTLRITQLILQHLINSDLKKTRNLSFCCAQCALYYLDMMNVTLRPTASVDSRSGCQLHGLMMGWPPSQMSVLHHLSQ